MSKKYEIGDRRYIVVKKDEICHFEDGSSKCATFTYPRWVHFVEQFDEIDQCVAKVAAKDDDVKLQLHIGGGWYVSVTSGFFCVDVRRFYLLPGAGVKPTRTGIALRFYEWTRLKATATEIRHRHPKVADAQPCWTGADHFNQEGAVMCGECNPFGDWNIC